MRWRGAHEGQQPCRAARPTLPYAARQVKAGEEEDDFGDEDEDMPAAHGGGEEGEEGEV